MTTTADFLRNELVKIAASQVGFREEGGNNKGAQIREYQQATWLKPDAWPWCAAFCAWVLCEALKTPQGIDYLKERGISVEMFRCQEASAFGWLKWAAKHKLTVFDENSTTLKPMAGDFIVFDFSHIGIVRGDISGINVPTIEGNTAPKAIQRDGTQDGVFPMLRNQSLVKGYIRL